MSNRKEKLDSRHVHVTSKIDNKAPHFNVSVYLNPFHLQRDAARVREIDAENMDLLKKLNIIHRSEGERMDCWAPMVTYKSQLSGQDNSRNIVIMKENRKILRRIRKATSQYPVREFLRKWRHLHRTMERHSRFAIERKSSALSAGKQLAYRSGTRCFFDVGLEEERQNLGRIVFELYDGIVPRTCENFAAFCSTVNGFSYRDTPFHRIVAGYWCQGGDVTKFNGTGGTSVYGDSFDSENFELRHTGPGILSTCIDNDGKGDSKFNLTFKRLETVDGKNVVFGQVVEGLANIYKIEEFGTKTGKPIKSVIVLNCGVLPVK